MTARMVIQRDGLEGFEDDGSREEGAGDGECVEAGEVRFG